MENITGRKRRAMRSRMKIRELGVPRLCVNKTSQHLYAQVIVKSPIGDKVMAAASTLEKDIKTNGGISCNAKSAKIIGKIIAERALANGVTRVAFDRSGFKYHGCVKALADAARETGLQF